MKSKINQEVGTLLLDYIFMTIVLLKNLKSETTSRIELEISALNQMYLKEKKLKVEVMGRGMAWFDTGTFILFSTSSYTRTLASGP